MKGGLESADGMEGIQEGPVLCVRSHRLGSQTTPTP